MRKPSEKIVIEVSKLTIGYDDYVVLKDLNFSVKESEIFVILGGSGCGKSTVLKHMIGLHKPIEGDILINGESIAKAAEQEQERI